ncbi:MAG: hypothetical protein HKN79_08345 [Flavobacteriales bacterium]|nr:hypothetical protein [Flavobacteriales bacterium]
MACEQPPPPEIGRIGDRVLFSGYAWDVKSSDILQGPGPNYFSDHPYDIYVDEDGYLHLHITERDGRWYSTEVVSVEEFGYGTYTFTVEGDYLNIPENIVVGLFTWDSYSFLEQANSEVDIEFSKWGDPEHTSTLQYAVQPVNFGPYYPERDYAPEGVEAYHVGVSTHQFHWTDSLITFRSFEGESTAPSDMFASWEFDLNNPPRVKNEGGLSSEPIVIPAPADSTNARINFWILPWVAPGPTDGERQELIVRSFNYIP